MERPKFYLVIKAGYASTKLYLCPSHLKLQGPAGDKTIVLLGCRALLFITFSPIPLGYMTSKDKNEFIIFVCIYLIDNLLTAFLAATDLEQICKSL